MQPGSHMWMAGDILLKADKMSMANSGASRVPFLDKSHGTGRTDSHTLSCDTGASPTKRPRISPGYAMRLAAAGMHTAADCQTQPRKSWDSRCRSVRWLEDKYYSIVRELL